MQLWTLQPLEIWKILQQSDSFHCNPEKCSMPEFQEQYGWLVEQMCNKIGPAPRGIELPGMGMVQTELEKQKTRSSIRTLDLRTGRSGLCVYGAIN